MSSRDKASLADPLDGGAAAGGGGGALEAAVGDMTGLETPGIGGIGRLALFSEEVEGLEATEGEVGSCPRCWGGDCGIGGGGPRAGSSCPALDSSSSDSEPRDSGLSGGGGAGTGRAVNISNRTCIAVLL